MQALRGPTWGRCCSRRNCKGSLLYRARRIHLSRGVLVRHAQRCDRGLQDLIDDPAKLKAFILVNWPKYCADKIAKDPVKLSPELTAHINAFDFSIFRAKQPQQLINEHAQTRYHLAVFGLPLINRPAPPSPPSTVAPQETLYVTQLY